MRATVVTGIIIAVLLAIVVLPDGLRGQMGASLQGTVKQVLVRRGVGDGHGTHILVASRNGPVEVCLGPTRFLEASHVMPQIGDSIVATGYPVTSADGELFIASTLTTGGRTFTLRSSTGKPRWSGCGHDCGRVGNCDQHGGARHGQDGQQ
jgi:hypothetical protein